MTVTKTKKALIPLVTNAPHAWPEVLVEEGMQQDPVASKIFFAAAVETAFKKTQLQVVEADVLRMVRGGVLEIPLRVKAPDTEYDVFFYPQANGEAAAHYAEVCALAYLDRRINPVFFSFADVQELPAVEIEPIIQRDKLHVKASLFPPGGEYAMWWSINEGERFENSDTFKLYNHLYRDICGLEKASFALIMLELQMIQDLEEFILLDLKGKPVEIPMEGPEGVPIIASYSDARGLRIQVHTRRGTPEYRDLFLSLVIQRFKHWRKIESITREETESEPLRWWQSVIQRLRAVPDEEVVRAIGALQR